MTSEIAKDGDAEAVRRLAGIAFASLTAQDIIDAVDGEAGLIDQALDWYRATMRPLRTVEPALDPRAGRTRRLDNAIRALGARCRPDMDSDVADEFAATTRTALSNLPYRTVVTAAEQAIHESFEHPGQVDAVVKRLEERIRQRHGFAMKLMEAAAEQMRRSKIEKPRAPEPPPLTPEEIAALSPEMRELGLSVGALTEIEIAAADALRAESDDPTSNSGQGGAPVEAARVGDAAIRVVGKGGDDAAPAS